ncbi:hypothetical protein AB0F11_29680 [Streptomyces sp. NPDC032472]|uniref:hypothetical protein n=1 Tax=Streptomyces sp. NPDC032472 TaxID=3155018 RepID=UPI0033EE4E25
MEDYAGRILAGRYRLPLPPSDDYELVETRAFDTRSGQEVLVRQVPLPEIVDAELLDGEADGLTGPAAGPGRAPRSAPQAGELPAVRRAIAAAQAAASVPDHPRLDQVFDVFAEGGSLWIVSELVPARPLAALLADEPLTPYRAAEVAADLLTALRALHAHGWTHRNITVRTVLICDDGRVVLTGLAAGAAEDALCGYDPVPPDPTAQAWDTPPPPNGPFSVPGSLPPGPGAAPAPPAGNTPPLPGGPLAPTPPGHDVVPARPGPGHAVPQTAPGALPARPGSGEPASRGYGSLPAQPGPGDPGPYAASGSDGPGVTGAGGAGRGDEAPQASDRRAGEGGYAPLVAPGYDTGPRYTDRITPGARDTDRPEPKAAARAGAIAAYRAGAQAATARVTEQRKAVPAPPAGPRPQGSNLPQGYEYPYGGPVPATPASPGTGQGAVPGSSGGTGTAPGSPSGTGASPAPGEGTAGAAASAARPGVGPDGESGAGTASGLGTAPGLGTGPGTAGGGSGSGTAPGARAGTEPAPGAEADTGIGTGTAMASGAGAATGTDATAGRGAGPTGGADGGAVPWHGAAPRRQGPLPSAEAGGGSAPHARPEAGPAGPVRPALPAQLALPQGYHQAEDPTAHLRPGRPGHPRPNLPIPAHPAGSRPAPPPGQQPADQTRAPHAAGGPAPHTPGAVPGPYATAEPRAGGVVSPGAGPDPAMTPRPESGREPGRDLHHAPATPGAGGGPQGPQGPQGPRGPRSPATPPPAPGREPGGYGGAWGGAGGGPRTGLDAERARQTRMAVVGAVTERWAPEQAAGAVSGPWQLAAPVGPATDLWALGALLYRAVQGHAPYPEDSVAELVEMVCAEPPAFAEECGPLRPVVESLLRQDPTERPDFEELRGWLRSLVRSAPEPDAAGPGALPAPEPDPARLPVVRRRGDLHGRHRNPAPSHRPRHLGRTLLLGVLALMAGAVAYAMLFLPRAQEADKAGKADAPAPVADTRTSSPAAAPKSPAPDRTPAPTRLQTPAPAPPGYTTQQDPEHFEIAVPDGWERRGMNEAGQVRYTDGQYVLTVVPGRDKVEGGNPDPATYQKDKEPELAPYRSSTWASGGDVKTTKVGQQLRVTGRYTWIDGAGRNVVARNFVVALGGSYHVVMVTGPQDGEGKVTEVFDKATGSYKSGG